MIKNNRNSIFSKRLMVVILFFSQILTSCSVFSVPAIEKGRITSKESNLYKQQKTIKEASEPLEQEMSKQDQENELLASSQGAGVCSTSEQANQEPRQATASLVLYAQNGHKICFDGPKAG